LKESLQESADKMDCSIMFTESGGGKNGGLSLKYVEKHVDKWKSHLFSTERAGGKAGGKCE